MARRESQLFEVYTELFVRTHMIDSTLPGVIVYEPRLVPHIKRESVTSRYTRERKPGQQSNCIGQIVRYEE